MPLSVPVTAIAMEQSAGYMGRAAAVSMQGIRPNFEDAHIVDHERGVLGVFDGHLGDEAAAFCAERLHLHCGRAGGELPSRFFLESAFERCDSELRSALPVGCEAGSTATLALVREEEEGSGAFKIWVANLGDSRAVLFRCKSGELLQTEDHRPDAPAERARIEAAGGFVSDEFGSARIDGALACSRALGAFKFKADKDRPLSEQKVSSCPDVFEWEAEKGDWLIIACDGVWDTLSGQKVIDEARNGTSGEDLGAKLGRILELCISKDADDNLTLVALEIGITADVPRTLRVSPGNFLKTKDKEVLEQYSAFCLRFGYVLERVQMPKAPPVASLKEAPAAAPGPRFAGLPPPDSGPATEAPAAVASGLAALPARRPQLRVNSKRSVPEWLKDAQELSATGGDSMELEVIALGRAVNRAAAVIATLQSNGFILKGLSTGLSEFGCQSGERICYLAAILCNQRSSNGSV